eukprot:1828069-Prymnesium_polylepis.1
MTNARQGNRRAAASRRLKRPAMQAVRHPNKVGQLHHRKQRDQHRANDGHDGTASSGRRRTARIWAPLSRGKGSAPAPRSASTQTEGT